MRRKLSSTGTLENAEMRADVRPIIEPEHAFHDRREPGGNRELAAADAKRLPAHDIALELGAERLLHRLHRAGKVDRALGEAHPRHVETMLVRESLDARHVIGIGAVARAEFVVV